ncbi:hypothetical protein AB0K93_05520 [Streptomyces sp. NPDC052676]|uniref:hypothetical protein n=1 Tax=Streptomyces sp. NPDC052676 TaxID=3154953 RepID=UPI0034253356
MADHGGIGSTAERSRRSPLTEYAESTAPTDRTDRAERPSGSSHATGLTGYAAERRREFAALLGEFRRTPVLVALDDQEAPLTADHGGIRWIYAFSDEAALARFAVARGQGAREWTYRKVLGARLLDVAVPAAGIPCGVALDVGSADGVVFPPVVGVVPDSAAVDGKETGGGLL